MFKFFRRRRDKPSVMYGVFQKMGNTLDKKQRRLTDYLNRKAAKLSKTQLKISLLIFCLLFAGGAILVTLQAFWQPKDTVQIRTIQVPQHVVSPQQGDRKETSLTQGEVENILSLQNYLDSLQATDSGRAIYDSIATYRPGLLDSLAFINQYYSNQLKQK